MGGVGSGGRNRLSDEEKKRRGTFRPDTSSEVYDQKAAAKVVSGPWLERIPEPKFPLGEVGREKYRELTEQLFSQNKLTTVTQMSAEVAATMFEKIFKLMSEGKHPSASDATQLQRALDSLKIAEDAPPLQNPEGRKNPFERSGFSNRPNSPFRLRRSAVPGSRG